MKNNWLKYMILAFSGLLVGLDQLFKWLAQEYLAPLENFTYPLIPDVFHLTYLENRGAAFGIFAGKSFFLIGLTSVILAAILILLLSGRIRQPFLMWSLGLIVGGGIGNLIDRIFRQYVIDYLDFRLINFAVFNFADCCVVVGTALVLIYLVFLEHRGKEKKDSTDAAEASETQPDSKEETAHE